MVRDATSYAYNKIKMIINKTWTFYDDLLNNNVFSPQQKTNTTLKRESFTCLVICD